MKELRQRSAQRRQSRSVEDANIGLSHRIFFLGKGEELSLRTGTEQIVVDHTHDARWEDVLGHLVKRGVLVRDGDTYVKNVKGFGLTAAWDVEGHCSSRERSERVPAFMIDSHVSGVGLQLYRERVRAANRRTRSGRLELISEALGVAMRETAFGKGCPNFQRYRDPISLDIVDALTARRAWNAQRTGREQQREIVGEAIRKRIARVRGFIDWEPPKGRDSHHFPNLKTELASDWAVRIVQAIRDENP